MTETVYLPTDARVHKAKQITRRIIWRETVRKMIDGLERLGS